MKDLYIEKEELKTLIDSSDVDLIDVRTEEEFNSLKKVPNTKNIPMKLILKDPEKYLSSKDRHSVIICNAGNRSTDVAKELRNLGYNAQSLRGGAFGYHREEK
ncbi:rhodanese-like domain-containing protein [Spiroplasma endosymbiont of Anurida maritima]|uniref:rhodanese-like domain-containing protein n=1 Tax=Spiroplasma endosymbiont of Anurida maritima TaxID=2967972 RepID=UPI0036D34B27